MPEASTKVARAARLNLSLGELASRLARLRVEAPSADMRDRVAVALDGLTDALDALDASIAPMPPAVDPERAAATVRRHVEAIGAIARHMAAGSEVQRASVLRLAADVAHEGRRLCVAMHVGRNALGTVDKETA